MPRRPDSTAKSHRASAIASICILVLIAAAIVYVRSAWVPFDSGISSIDPADYPAASAEIRKYFPQDARFLPDAIPRDATSVKFECSTLAGLQASPWLKLSFNLAVEDAQQEFARLKALSPTDILKQGIFFDDPLDHLQPSDDFIVLGYLRPFEPDYRKGPVSPPDRLAYVTYDRSTGEFYYEFNSD